jgi:hypothetical protein
MSENITFELSASSDEVNTQDFMPIEVQDTVISEDRMEEAPIEEEEPVIAAEEEPVVPVVEEESVAVAEEPVAVVEEPVAVVEEPVAETPVVEEPVVVVEEPVAVVEEPVVPVVEEPVVEAPVVEEPVVPVVEEPVVPVVETPVVPAAEEPVVEQIPKIVFIVPYRDREQQYQFFSKHMKTIMEDEPRHKIFYIHQCDQKDFNRGAMKNIGFLYVKNKYPNDYRNITLVFNDIDIMPLTKNFFQYDTIQGNIKHFYGFEFTLGGIVSIKAGDFEEINGFPNFWAWGYEDNLLQKRVLKANKKIDRSQFYKIMDKNILILHDGVSRTVNKREFDRYLQDTPEGIQSIHQLSYTVDEATGFVNVQHFRTNIEPEVQQNREYDLREGPRPFGNPVQVKRRGRMGMIM